MKNQLRKLGVFGLVLLLSTLVLLPITQADSSQRVTAGLHNSTSTLNNVATISFANTTPIRIPGVVGQTSGSASPYPSVINVSGISEPITGMTVKLVSVSHTFPDDIDVLLVGPLGQKLIIMSDAGGGTDIVNATITIDDAAALALPDSTSINTGIFRPANYSPVDAFVSVAAPYQSAAPTGAATMESIFGSGDPNGNWQLFIVDDTGGDSGIVNGGWELTFATDGTVTPPCELSCPSSITVDSDPGSCGAVVNYPNATIEGDCGTVSYSHPSGSVFPLGTTTVTVTATPPGMPPHTCNFNITVTDDEAPTVMTNLGTASLEHPFNHSLEPVGLSGTVSDNCSAASPIELSVFSNEDDDVGGEEGGFSPDATDIDLGTLRLRRERLGTGDGRVYLIIGRAADTAGSTGYSCNAVTVPLSNSAAHKNAVSAKAAAAITHCQNTGAPPAGYVAVGDGPTSGPKQ